VKKVSRAGSPRVYREVGNILNKNFNPTIPCHRVIRSDGKLGGYNRGAEEGDFGDGKTQLFKKG